MSIQILVNSITLQTKPTLKFEKRNCRLKNNFLIKEIIFSNIYLVIKMPNFV